MENDTLLDTDAWVITLLLFASMLLASFLGKITGNYFRQKAGEGRSGEASSLTALLFFLLAFTYGMSSSRYDSRRQIVVEEANDIGTAILRSDLYPDTIRAAFRRDFQDYVETRIDYYQASANVNAVLKSDSLSQVIATKLGNVQRGFHSILHISLRPSR